LTGSLGTLTGSFSNLARTVFTTLGPIALLMKAIMPLVRMFETMLMPLFVPLENAIASLMMTTTPLVYKIVPHLQAAMVKLVPYVKAVIKVFADLVAWFGKNETFKTVLKYTLLLVAAFKVLAVALWVVLVPIKLGVTLYGVLAIVKSVLTVATLANVGAIWKENSATELGTTAITINRLAIIAAVVVKTAWNAVIWAGAVAMWALSKATGVGTVAGKVDTIQSMHGIIVRKAAAAQDWLCTAAKKAFKAVLTKETYVQIWNTATKKLGIIADKAGAAATWLGTLAKNAYLLVTGQVSAATIWFTLCRWKATAAGAANTAATWLANTATAIYTAVVGASTVALIWNTVCKWASTAASFAWNVVMGVGVGITSLYTAVIVTVTIVAWAFNTALYACPVVWIVVGIVAVIAAIVGLVWWMNKSSSSFSKFGKIALIVFFPILGPILLVIWAVKKLWSWVGGSSGLISAFKSLGSTIWDTLKPVGVLFDWVVSGVKKLWHWIVGASPGLIPAFKMLGKIALVSLFPVLIPLKLLVWGVKELWDLVGGSSGLASAFKYAGKIVKATFGDWATGLVRMWNVAKSVFGRIGEVVGNIFSKISGVIKSTFGRISGVVASAMDMFKAPFKWLGDKFEWLMSKIQWLVDKWNWVKKQIDDAKEVAKQPVIQTQLAMGTIPYQRVGNIRAEDDWAAQGIASVFSGKNNVASDADVARRVEDLAIRREKKRASEVLGAVAKVTVEKPSAARVSTNDINTASSRESRETLRLLNKIADGVDNKPVVDSIDRMREDSALASTRNKDEDNIAISDVDSEVLSVAEYT